MADIVKSSISLNSVRMFSPDANQAVSPEALVSVEDAVAGQENAVRARFRFDFDLLQPGAWNIIFNERGAVDASGSTNEAALILWSFRVVDDPLPTTDTSSLTVRSETEFTITFTPPGGYELQPFGPQDRIFTRIFSPDGVEVGSGLGYQTNKVRIPPITEPLIYTLQHTGFYADGKQWSLTETVEILPAAIPGPTTDTSTAKAGITFVVTFTPPEGYELKPAGDLDDRIQTRILFDGLDIGAGQGLSTNQVQIPPITTPGTYTLRHTGFYTDGSQWTLTETVEILPFFSILARPRQSTTNFDDGDVFTIPANRSYYDIEYVIETGTVTEFRLFKDEVEKGEYPTSFDGWLYQSFGYRRYAYRVRDEVGDMFATPATIRVVATLEDGQTYTHSVTLRADTVRSPGIYLINLSDGDSLPMGSVFRWQIGHPDPAKALVSVSTYSLTPGGQGTGGGYGDQGSVAATVVFEETMRVAGAHGAIATYTYTDSQDIYRVALNSEAPPPDPPPTPFLFSVSGNQALGTEVTFFWNSAEIASRQKERITFELTAPNTAALVEEFDALTNSGTRPYVPRNVGSYRARLAIKYLDWAIPVLSDWIGFEGVLPPAPQNFSVNPRGVGLITLQWQEAGISKGVFATRYILEYLEPDGTQSEQTLSGSPTENAQIHSYRSWEGQVWDRTLQVRIRSEWNGSRSDPSEYVNWVLPAERTFANMDAAAPTDLATVKSAIDLGPTAGTAAQNAGDANFAQTGDGGQAANAFLAAYRARTYDLWASVQATATDPNLRAVAAANVAWLLTPGQPGLLDALFQCVANDVIEACTVADSAEDNYLTYMRYVANTKPDTILSINDWVAAGRPTS